MLGAGHPKGHPVGHMDLYWCILMYIDVQLYMYFYECMYIEVSITKYIFLILVRNESCQYNMCISSTTRTWLGWNPTRKSPKKHKGKANRKPSILIWWNLKYPLHTWHTVLHCCSDRRFNVVVYDVQFQKWPLRTRVVKVSCNKSSKEQQQVCVRVPRKGNYTHKGPVSGPSRLRRQNTHLLNISKYIHNSVWGPRSTHNNSNLC